MYSVKDILDLSHTLAGDYIEKFAYPWQALKGIGEDIAYLSLSLSDDYVQIKNKVWVHKTATIASTAFIGEQTIIGAYTQVRPSAFIRGCALVGENCVVGNCTELKNVILFDCVAVPHYNYVGDSILGYRAHMGAGAITSNVKSDKTTVTVNGEVGLDTGLKKFGAIIGDFVEVGCNSVLNPGTVIGRHTTVYPLTSVRGIVPSNSKVKSGQYEIVKRR